MPGDLEVCESFIPAGRIGICQPCLISVPRTACYSRESGCGEAESTISDHQRRELGSLDVEAFENRIDSKQVQWLLFDSVRSVPILSSRVRERSAPSRTTVHKHPKAILESVLQAHGQAKFTVTDQGMGEHCTTQPYLLVHPVAHN